MGLFGTDGIRGVAGLAPLDETTIRALGQALVILLKEVGLNPVIILGRDTRESGIWIQEILTQGVTIAGGKVVAAGIIPTSAIALLTTRYNFSAGVVLSASHNPYKDNGIKIFSGDGVKIPEQWENVLENLIETKISKNLTSSLNSEDQNFEEDYTGYLKSRVTIPALTHNARIAVDCSNGASFRYAPRIFEELGFEVIPINCSPDGRNINLNCGSLHPESLAKKVKDAEAHLGIAYDGDADRAIWVDEKGRILNGDHTLFVLAKYMKEKNRLNSSEVVATTMSNLGLELGLKKEGLTLVRTKVGDKYVLEEMMKRGANLGGEQSGHTIFLDDLKTGDGILTSLKMLEVMVNKGCGLSDLVASFEEYPQILLNVPVARKIDFKEIKEIMDTLAHVRMRLKDEGRVDLRYSGTEQLARIMVEGPDRDVVESLAHELSDVVARHLG